MKKGENVIAVSVTLPIAEGKAVLNLRLDQIPETERLPGGVEGEAKMVTEKAVVCDLCTSLSSKEPMENRNRQKIRHYRSIMMRRLNCLNWVCSREMARHRSL